jgi:hypothetical protein
MLRSSENQASTPEAVGRKGDQTLELALVNFAYEWLPVEQAPGIAYHFPEDPSALLKKHWVMKPAVYRWLVYKTIPGDLKEIYVGETDQLSRRIQHYLRPGPSQATNKRINYLFHQRAAAGCRIVLQYLSFTAFHVGGHVFSPNDLTKKHIRVALEHLFFSFAVAEGYTLHNASAKAVSNDRSTIKP